MEKDGFALLGQLHQLMMRDMDMGMECTLEDAWQELDWTRRPIGHVMVDGLQILMEHSLLLKAMNMSAYARAMTPTVQQYGVQQQKALFEEMRPWEDEYEGTRAWVLRYMPQGPRLERVYTEAFLSLFVKGSKTVPETLVRDKERLAFFARECGALVEVRFSFFCVCVLCLIKEQEQTAQTVLGHMWTQDANLALWKAVSLAKKRTNHNLGELLFGKVCFIFVPSF